MLSVCGRILKKVNQQKIGEPSYAIAAEKKAGKTGGRSHYGNGKKGKDILSQKKRE